jgi:Asp-tRNA(Asn)/Glu-tRNA(Gln) amidotransferase A subunit family amidase
MARTVTDAVTIFDVIAGYDPADAVTAASQGKRADSYVKFLERDGVRGTRLGVVRQLFTPPNVDPEVLRRMEQALSDLRRLGAAIVDPVQIPEIDGIPPAMLFCFRFKQDINEYLPRLAPDAPVKTLEDIIKSGKFHPSIEKRLLDRQAEPPLNANPRCDQVAQNMRQMRESVQR